VVTLALVQLIPEAFVLSPHAPWLVLTGFAAGFVLQACVSAGAADTARVSRFAALIPVVAIAVHSALDGTVYAITAALDAFTAISTSLGLILHELPETLICFILLQRAGFSDRWATGLAFLAAGATTLGAALLAGPFAPQLQPELLGALFAIVAGLLLHVGASHLLSEAAEAGALRGTMAVFAGAGVAALMALAHAASHDHSHEHPAFGAEHPVHEGEDHDHTGHDHALEAPDDHDHAPHDAPTDPDDGA